MLRSLGKEIVKVNFAFLLLTYIFTLHAYSAELKFVSLNLHAHHPMNEERRIAKDKVSWSHLFYFKKEELARGLDKRQKLLTEHLTIMGPDIVFFQEVASSLGNELNCESFNFANDAIDLNKRLHGYKVHSACRGNVGWVTDKNTFSEFDILSEKTNQTIFKSGDNPYPKGLLVEGTAILTSSKILVQKHVSTHLPFFLQWIKFKVKGEGEKWWIAANVHAGHKVQHFEQAVAARWALSQFINESEDRVHFSGMIIAGDFNAFLPQAEVSTTPWSFFDRWQTRELLTNDLHSLNNNRQYKEFASLPRAEAEYRIQKSVGSLFDWFALKRHELDSSLEEVFSKKKCRFGWKELNPMCDWEEKIDHIFITSNIQVSEASGLYSHHNWTDLDQTLSDHPGVWAKLKL